MKNLTIYLSAFAIAVGGVAIHVNASTESHRAEGERCFQLAPLAGKGISRAQAEDGGSRTLEPYLQSLAEDGFSHSRGGLRTAVLAPGVIPMPTGERLEVFDQAAAV